MSDEIGALSESIVKWESIVDGSGTDRGIANCALCLLYHENDGCSGCVVARVTKSKSKCGGTPYDDWREHQYKVHGRLAVRSKATCSECVRIATEELNFLKGLLPGGEG